MWWKTGTAVALTLLIAVASARAAEPARANAADTVTLKLTKANNADVEDTHWRYRRRAFYFGFYTPYVYPYYADFYPRYYYRSYAYYYPPPVVYYSTPTYNYPISLVTTATQGYADAAYGQEMLQPSADRPPPRPPQEDHLQPMKTPPTASVPLEGRSVSLPAAKPNYTYAAYGEEEKTKKENRTVATKKEPGKK